jgi:hypothetical protein
MIDIRIAGASGFKYSPACPVSVVVAARDAGAHVLAAAWLAGLRLQVAPGLPWGRTSAIRGERHWRSPRIAPAAMIHARQGLARQRAVEGRTHMGDARTLRMSLLYPGN